MTQGKDARTNDRPTMKSRRFTLEEAMAFILRSQQIDFDAPQIAGVVCCGLLLLIGYGLLIWTAIYD